MRLFRHYQNLPPEVRGSAVAVGNFDGVHLGHRSVIGEAGRIARSLGIPWAVMTFEPHPRTLFEAGAAPFRLTPFHRKARLIEELGVEVLVVVHFDPAFARLSARAFVEQVLVEGLAARSVVSGHNFAFGRGREGTPELLLHLGGEFGFDFTCVQEIRDREGKPYSSSRIRSCLVGGDPVTAARVLGRPFEIEGRVVEGDHRGRAIGYPTANVPLDDYLRPAFGAYAVRVAVEDGCWWDGVANIGVRPSFAGSEALLEVHLFGFEGDLYGRHLRVALVDFLRAEKKFDGVAALRAQIATDSARAKHVLTVTAAQGARLQSQRTAP